LKRCLSCGDTFVDVGWRCPRCGRSPATIQGFVAFAPALSDGQEGFVPEAHAVLDRRQDPRFWFRAGNRLGGGPGLRFAPKAAAVMEIGCGTGYVIMALQRALPDARICGSEVDAGALPLARQRAGAAIELFQMDARAIPFTAEFDLLCAFDVLEHVEE